MKSVVNVLVGLALVVTLPVWGPALLALALLAYVIAVLHEVGEDALILCSRRKQKERRKK